MNFLTIIKKYYPIIFFIALVIVSVFLFQTCSTLKTERAQWEFQQKQNTQNWNASKDSLFEEFNRKLNAFITSKDNYVINEIKDLKKYNQDLYNQLKNLKGDVIAAIDTKVSGDLGGLTAGNELVIIDSNTNNYALKFESKFKDKGFEQYLTGFSRFYAYPDFINKKWVLKPDTTIFETNLTKINITYGFRNLNDKYEVYAISPSPKIQINNLDGVFILDKAPEKTPLKPKNFSFGPYVGFGLNTDYNLANPRFGWSMGVSVHYNIWSWRWGKK